MNTGDKIGLRFTNSASAKDTVEYEVVYIKPHPAKADEARVYRSEEGYVRVYLRGSSESSYFRPNGQIVPDPTAWHESSCNTTERLTGPEAAEYVAAAREWRDAVWPPREIDPWPHWYAKEGDTFLRLYHDTENHELMSPGSDTTDKWSLPNETNIVNHGYRRITDLEAAAIKAKWEGERKPKDDPYPHWYKTSDETLMWVYSSPDAGITVSEKCGESKAYDTETAGTHIRISSSEAAAIKAKWEGERKGKEEPAVIHPPKDGVWVHKWLAEELRLSNGGTNIDHLNEMKDWFCRRADYDAAALINWVKKFASPTPQPELPTAESIAEGIINRGSCFSCVRVCDAVDNHDKFCSETCRDDFIDRFQKAIASAIRTDRQARSGERGG
jgi:hypothetical protein